MPDVEITRKQIVVIDTVENNQYGDLTFKDKEGNGYKVGSKRIAYFKDVIIPGMAVQLNYAVYKGREFVYSAELVKDALPPATIPKTGETIAQIKASEALEQKPQAGAPKETIIPGQQIGMTVKEIGDMIRATKLALLFGDEIAVELTKWYRGQILATTRITYDGNQLPTLIKKSGKDSA